MNSLKKYALAFIIISLIFGISWFFSNKKLDEKEDDDTKYIDSHLLGDELSYTDFQDLNFDHTIYVTNYNQYKSLVDNYDLIRKLNVSDFEKNDYVLVKVQYDSCREKIIGVLDTKISNDTFTVTFGYEAKCGGCAPNVALYLVPVEKGQNTEYKLDIEYQSMNDPECDPDVVYKPIIYLYPKEEMEVTVKLGYPENLTTTYPKYENEWRVYAYPNGDLIDLKTNRNLYALYWEGIHRIPNQIKNDGFVVSRDEIIPFLEEKLELLGLNDHEANEFIMYWLPILESSEYNYIRFANIDEINTNMPLKISPTPDTVIRVLMEYKPLSEPIDVEEQQLITPKRIGFTVVEWGGTKIGEKYEK